MLVHVPSTTREDSTEDTLTFKVPRDPLGFFLCLFLLLLELGDGLTGKAELCL